MRTPDANTQNSANNGSLITCAVLEKLNCRPAETESSHRGWTTDHVDFFKGRVRFGLCGPKLDWQCRTVGHHLETQRLQEVARPDAQGEPEVRTSPTIHVTNDDLLGLFIGYQGRVVFAD